MKYKLSDYNITNEPLQEGKSREILDILQEIHIDVAKGRKYLLKKLPKLIKKYPKEPIFKNHLIIVYEENGMKEKAYELCKEIVAKHPDYFMGKINLSAFYIKEGKLDLALELLGEDLELKSLFPNKERFHTDMIFAYNNVVIRYLTEKKEFDRAEEYLAFLRDLDPSDPKLSKIEQYINFSKNMDRMSNMFLNTPKNTGDKAIEKRAKIQTEKPPKFHFPKEMNWLYKKNSINKEEINHILNLNKDLLEEDLISILNDCIVRYDYFESNEDISNMNFYAILLLSELKSEKALNVYLEKLRQDDEFSDFWYGDFYSDLTIIYISSIIENNIDKLFDFLKESDIYQFHKYYIVEALLYISEKQPNYREQIINKLKNLLEFYIKNGDDILLSHPTLNAFIGLSVSDFKINELVPNIKELYKRDLMDISVMGDMADFEEYLLERKGRNPYEERKLLQGTSVYENFNILDEILNKKPNDTPLPFDENLLNESVSNKNKKIGRNEPCPCGSGKKYKKCCLNN